ncbi:CRISPR-associated protein, Cas6 family [Methanobrevibacter olleyae]|uniref:CRISPR-associated protein, Cas6 family n=1 Tax=Methanobrevibacter olleyae TaxID=294671 RepID=A0A1I4K7A0_METOL|nr:CRISPR-associated endoribonuclease Cas6 [Methanobrevibacter olleyae]SFL74645.1 CRISPR-associated protein, Cas6 family [Methanobrevibacter olleyae]
MGDRIRLILEFKSLNDCKYSDINKYDIQGFIYSLLKYDLVFKNYHDVVGFKFFNFSNIFPVSNFKKGTIKKLIISSPNSKFIYAVRDSLNEKENLCLNKLDIVIQSIKIINPKESNKFISSTPIVLFEDNSKNQYYSFKQNPDFDFFFNRLKDNAIKKYNAYTEKDFYLEDNLFNSFEFKREVSVRVRKNNNTFVIIGSLWKSLEIDINKENKDFYKFLLDTGLGEKNSLGFGMINDVR